MGLLAPTIRIDDFGIADVNTAHVVAVPAAANKFTAQLSDASAAALGTDLVVKAKWSVIPDDVYATRLWSDFGTAVELKSGTDYGAQNVDIAADWLVFEVTTAGNGTSSSARLFVNFYSRPGGP